MPIPAQQMPNPLTVAGTASPDLTLEQIELQRRQQMADALKQQALSPIEQQTVSGGAGFGQRVVPISPMQGVAKLAQALMAGKMQSENDQKYSSLLQTAQAKQNADIAAFLSEKDPTRKMQIGLANPTLAPVVLKQMEKDGYTLKPGEKRFDNSNNVVGEVRPLNDIAPNGIVYNKADIQPGQVFNDPNKLMFTGTNGQPQVNIPFFNAEKQLKEAGRNIVSVNTAQQPFLHELGKGAAESVLNTFNAAQQGISTLNNVAQIKAGMDKAFTGPGANARVKLAQIGTMLGVGGKDDAERLQNTRNVIQGLARQELAAAGQMRGQGQITENERALLRRAESGEITDFSKAELQTLVGALEKTAQYRISIHRQNVARLQKDPNSAPMVQYLTLPDTMGDIHSQADAILNGGK